MNNPKPANPVSGPVVAAGTARTPKNTAGKQTHATLSEALDRLLTKGAVLKGEITISIANVDLVYLGFHVLLASVDTARTMMQPCPPAAAKQENPPC